MTKAEAQAECRRLADGHPDRKTHQWLPRRGSDEEWTVVKIGLAPSGVGLVPETRAAAKPEQPDDPRSAAFRNLGPNVGPGV